MYSYLNIFNLDIENLLVFKKEKVLNKYNHC